MINDYLLGKVVQSRPITNGPSKWNLTDLFLIKPFPLPYQRFIKIIYFIAQKKFLFNIFKAFLAFQNIDCGYSLEPPQ